MPSACCQRRAQMSCSRAARWRGRGSGIRYSETHKNTPGGKCPTKGRGLARQAALLPPRSAPALIFTNSPGRTNGLFETFRTPPGNTSIEVLEASQDLASLSRMRQFRAPLGNLTSRANLCNACVPRTAGGLLKIDSICRPEPGAWVACNLQAVPLWGAGQDHSKAANADEAGRRRGTNRICWAAPQPGRECWCGVAAACSSRPKSGLCCWRAAGNSAPERLLILEGRHAIILAMSPQKPAWPGRRRASAGQRPRSRSKPPCKAQLVANSQFDRPLLLPKAGGLHQQDSKHC